MQDSKINGTLAIIGYITASISVILTSIFMIKLGGDDKFLQCLFLVLGASLDIVKHILPIVIFYTLSRKQWGFSAILSVVYCLLGWRFSAPRTKRAYRLAPSSAFQF